MTMIFLTSQYLCRKKTIKFSISEALIQLTNNGTQEQRETARGQTAVSAVELLTTPFPICDSIEPPSETLDRVF